MSLGQERCLAFSQPALRAFHSESIERTDGARPQQEAGLNALTRELGIALLATVFCAVGYVIQGRRRQRTSMRVPCPPSNPTPAGKAWCAPAAVEGGTWGRQINQCNVYIAEV